MTIPPRRDKNPSVVHGLIDSNRMTSLEIDRWVGERLGSNQGLYLLDEERLRGGGAGCHLDPGLVRCLRH